MELTNGGEVGDDAHVAQEHQASDPRYGVERRQRRLLVAEVCISLLVLAVCELGVRWYVAHDPAAPLPRLFNSSIATAKYLAFREAAKVPHALDAVVMGLSPFMRVKSRGLQEVLRGHGREVGVFNFASPFHSIDYDQCLLRDIVLDLAKPKVVVYGLMPFNLLYEDSRVRSADEMAESIPGFALHRDTLAARVQAAVLTKSYLLLYREVIRDAVLRVESKPDPWVKRARRIDRMGDTAPSPPRPPAPGLAPWEKQYYAPRLRKFQEALEKGFVFDHIGRLARFCRQHGIRMAIVNSAVHPSFVDLLPNGRADYDEFVQRTAEAAAANGAPFLDLSGPSLGRPDWFVDSHHHNEPGSAWMTEQVATFLLRQGLLEDGDIPGA